MWQSYIYLSKTCEVHFFRCNSKSLCQSYKVSLIFLSVFRFLLFLLQENSFSLLLYAYLILFSTVIALVNTLHMCILVSMNQHQYVEHGLMKAFHKAMALIHRSNGSI